VEEDDDEEQEDDFFTDFESSMESNQKQDGNYKKQNINEMK